MDKQPPKLDRRIVRTRRRLSEALLELMREEPFEAITIQNITDRADLNRATFYLHYSTKEELLIASLEARFDELVKEIETTLPLSPERPLWTDCEAERMVFSHVKANVDLYRVILSDRGLGAVTHRIIKYIAEVAKTDLQKSMEGHDMPDFPLEVVSNHYAGGLFSLLIWWIENDFPIGVDEIAKISHNISLNGSLSLFRQHADNEPA